MKQITSEVKSARLKGGGETADKKRVVVGTATYPEYEILSEAIEALGEKTILDLVNAQVATNEKNRVRAEAVGTPSEEKLKNEAFQRILNSDDLRERFRQNTGNQVAINAIINEVVNQIKVEKGIAVEDDEA